MGSCFGRCQCPCCDFLVLRQRDNIRICRDDPSGSDPKRVLRRSSSTLEFENLMFEFDVKQNTISTLVHRKQPFIDDRPQPLSITDRQAANSYDNRAISISKELNVTYYPKEYQCNIGNNNGGFFHDNSNRHICGSSNGRQSLRLSSFNREELPIINPLMQLQYHTNNSIHFYDPHHSLMYGHILDQDSDSPASSHGPSRGESAADTNSNNNELEWDDYDQENLAVDFNQETEILINEIDEMKNRVLRDT